MFEWLGISAVNPALLWGSLAIASPIIIHLLSKRKFKIVDWAAMDFLLAADKRNRRRVRMENLLLLLLRCLAVLLLALLVSRPFLQPKGLASFAMQAVHYERIVMLDDSPSMAAQADAESTFDKTKAGLAQMVRDLAAERPGDTLVLMTTSQPDRKVVAGKDLSNANVEPILKAIEGLEVSDLPARYDQALSSIEQALESSSGHLNRIVYLVTDLRKSDWETGKATPSDDANPAPAGDASGDASTGSTDGAAAPVAPTAKAGGVVERIKLLSEKSERFFIMDVGEPVDINVTVAAITPREKALVAGVNATFDVTLRNTGSADADDVEVSFTAGDSVPLKTTVPVVRAGEPVTVPFTFRFTDTGSTAIQAEVGADAMPIDNARFLAARVSQGVQTLIVDGDPSSDPDEAESLYLNTAISPPRYAETDAFSGYAAKIVTENQFEAMPLDDYQVIYLCNLYRITDDRAAALKTWVEAGGGLVIFLGDQIDDQNYNARYDEGKGIVPARLTDILGDESERKWVNIDIQDGNHPVMGSFADPVVQPLLQGVKIFRWWHTDIDKKTLASGAVRVPVRLTGPEGSPLIVDKPMGKGRVVMFSTACDADWSAWPDNPSYTIAAQELSGYVARRVTEEGNVPVGTPLRYALDPARHAMEAMVRPPGEAEPVPAERDESGKQLFFAFENTQRRGVYALELTKRDGGQQSVLFAANIDAGEGMLGRIEPDTLRQDLGEARVELLEGATSLSADTAGARSEFWRTVLIAVLCVLALESFLAWTFGTRRR